MDPHRSEKADPDPRQCDADPQHWPPSKNLDVKPYIHYTTKVLVIGIRKQKNNRPRSSEHCYINFT
jgi:hypothetical protein